MRSPKSVITNYNSCKESNSSSKDIVEDNNSDADNNKSN